VNGHQRVEERRSAPLEQAAIVGRRTPIDRVHPPLCMLGSRRYPVEDMSRFFVLSPADCAGRRARPLLDGTSTSPLRDQLRSPGGVALGELFAMLSPLYFRGKLAYARRFAAPEKDLLYVITPSRGLLSPAAPIELELLDEFSATRVSNTSVVYRAALLDTARARASDHRPSEVVFLGSVATDKYIEPLLYVFGRRLLFPAAFVGRGSLSRGSLLLETVDSGSELPYVTARTARRSTAAIRSST
jgi:hypothetical protein